jgi:hypothetical protein
MMVKVVFRRIVHATNIDNTCRNIREIIIGWFTSLNGHIVQMSK